MYDNNVLSHLFDKTTICPVCNNTFKTRTVKAKASRISSKDSDFFIRYSVVNPYFYDVCICNCCGYSAMRSDFEHLNNFRKDLVSKNITPKWKSREYPDVYDEHLAIERYKLALLTAVLTEMPDSSKAMISLKIAWMYRLLNDEKQEQSFLKQALAGFTDAYQNEPFPIYGLQRDSLMYLLGELNRRIGNNEQALQWFGKTLVHSNSSYKVKEMARNGKDLIKNK